jgi:hypothetical protein
MRRAAIRRQKWSFYDLVHAKCGRLCRYDLVIRCVTLQCCSQYLPGLWGEAKAHEKGGLATPITMTEREQIAGDLALRNHRLLVLRQFHRVYCSIAHGCFGACTAYGPHPAHGSQPKTTWPLPKRPITSKIEASE